MRAGDSQYTDIADAGDKGNTRVGVFTMLKSRKGGAIMKLWLTPSSSMSIRLPGSEQYVIDHGNNVADVDDSVRVTVSIVKVNVAGIL